MVRVWGVRRFVGGAVAALAISALPGLIGGATPAAAASNDITLSTTGRLNAIVVSKAASHPVEFGLESPRLVQVCANCAKGNQKSVGSVSAGVQPVFYISDPANGSHCLSTDPAHAAIEHPSMLEWVIRWDASCPGPGAQHFTDLVTRILLEPQVSSDPYTNSDSQHATEVEPDTFAWAGTMVAAFQVGRFFNGGSSNIGWATSTDNGATWRRGFLPSTTVNSSPPGPWARLSDPSVGYDARHGQWLIASLPVSSDGGIGPNIIVSRSTNGTTWGAPVTVVPGTHSYDKEWIACDNSGSSPSYGNCYLAWDDPGNGGRIRFSRSTDGGLSWSAPQATSDQTTGIGVQIGSLSSGKVVLVFLRGGEIVSSVSTNGGVTFGAAVTVAPVCHRDPAGALRADLSLPSLARGQGGTFGEFYVVWSDCAFRSAGNDIVLSTSTNGTTWTAKQRIPIDQASSTVDHFIPGLDADPNQAGPDHLALTYYSYPNGNCTASTCRLAVGFTSSTDSGSTWKQGEVLSPAPMQLGWLADTNQGRMVGDYVSTSFIGGQAFTVFSWALAPASSTAYRQVMLAASRKVPSVG